MRIHISLLNCRGEEKMPARPCPIRSVRSGPSGLSGPGALGPGHWSGPYGPDRAGTARWPSLAWPCPVRSGPSGPLQCRMPGPDGPDRTGPDGTPDHLIFSLFDKRWSFVPKQAFGPKVMECCSKTCFWRKGVR